MADEHDDSDRTEDPTPKRLDDAIRRGDVAKSPEVNTWFMIAGGTLVIMVFAAPMAASLQDHVPRPARQFLSNLATDGPALAALAKTLATEVAAAFGIPLVLLMRRRACRQRRSAPHRLLDRAGQTAVVEDFAGRRRRPTVLAPGARQFRQGSRQALPCRRRHGVAAVAAASPSRAASSLPIRP